MAEDIDRFIQEQKSKLARERNNLQQDSPRKGTEQDSGNYPPTGINGYKENIPPPARGAATDSSKALPAGSHSELRDKLARERQEEYQKYLSEKSKRTAPRAPPPQEPRDGASLPIPSRDSAKERSRLARNKEYNDFLKNKGGSSAYKPRVGNEELAAPVNQRGGSVNPITGQAATNTSPAQTGQQNGYPPPPQANSRPSGGYQPPPQPQPQDTAAEQYTRREAASQTPRPILRDYDDRPPPGPPPPGPRRGWGTPQPDYDEILRRKREEEARYRRYDDDYDYYPPRGGIRPSYSEPHLNRYPPDDGRYSRARYDYYDPEYDRRRVRFTDAQNPDNRGYPPPGSSRYDRPPVDRPPVGRPPPPDAFNDPQAYDWNLSRGGRSRTLPEMDRQRSNSRADGVNGTAPPANADSKPPRAKSATLPAEEIGIVIGNRDTASATRRKKEQYRKELEEQMKEAQEAKKREKQEELRINASGARDPAKKPEALGFGNRSRNRTPVPAAAQQPPPQQPTTGQPIGYQPSFLNQAYPNAQGASLAPQVPVLGLEEAIAKSRMGEAPLIDKPFSLNNYPSAVTVNSTDPYLYYGIRNPLDPDPADFASQILQRPMMSNAVLPSNYGTTSVPPGLGGVPLNLTPQENLALLNASATAQIRGESSIKGFVGDSTLNHNTVNDPKSYQAILQQQILEKERKKRYAKQEQERYDAKLEAQAAEYNPWGKGGGGAPMRDNRGKIVADLRQLHNQNEQNLKEPSSMQSPMLNAANAVAEKSPRAGAAEGPSADPVPVSTAPKDPKDEYKEYLRQQVEDKKKREAALKEKIRLEEEREERRLADQRLKMQRDFEQEQQRMKEKEEEKRKQKEQLERKIEEQKKEAEKKKHDAIEAKRKEADRDKQRQEPTDSNQNERYSPPAVRTKEDQPRSSSPPIPTLRKKQAKSEEQPRSSSPPIPTLRKKQDKKEDSPKTTKEVHGTPRQPPGEQGSPRDGPDGAGRDPRDVMSALSAMRRQLHSEQQRIQNQLDKNKERDPYNPGPKPSSRRTSPQVDVFEVARHKAPVAVRREPLTHHTAAADFSNLKNRETNSRQKLREQFPEQPSSDLTLEAQQRVLLRHQQDKLDSLRRGKTKVPLEDQMPGMNPRDLGRSDSPLLALQSESAFIGINNGITDIPNTPPHRKRPPSPRRDYGEPSTSVTVKNKSNDPLGSTMSFDNDTIDYLTKKNQERNKALNQLEADGTSLADPDDILQRFMMRSSHDRPRTGKSDNLSLWLQPTDSD